MLIHLLFAAHLAATTPADLDRILADPQLDGAIVSAIVTDMAGVTIYEHNSGLHVVPASNQKLLSNSFALWELGADYRPATSFWKMNNRIVIDAPGDPLMSYDLLKATREKLGTTGRLPVFVREAYAPEIPDGWEIDDLPNKFAAPVAALTFDRGAFSAWDKHGHATLEPQAFGVRVEMRPSQAKPVIHYDPFARVLQITGKLDAKDHELDTLALPRPDEAAASIFGSSFHRTDDLPQRSPDQVIVGSSTMEMVAACLPPSDNNIAENLLLMGAMKQGPLGGQAYPLACKRMADFLTHVVGIAPGEVHPRDGSGLSRHDYVTTRAIAKLLSWADSQPTSALWHHALARPGTGTLTHRLSGITFEGKTGSLDMDASLSGYLTTRSGKRLIVSVILNQFSCSEAAARGVADALVRALAAD